MAISDRASRLTTATFCLASSLVMLSRLVFPQYTLALWLLGVLLILVALVLALRVNHPGKRFYLLMVGFLLAPWLILLIRKTM